ncbi:STAS domain-containing protein [Nucisporomicrobium flavum]|jgi:anti-sigma B factor antagonist|uniref:STAS domain-containing protein n=1 Tax=Nucisporomicrobium flavum TaxID=2785915 RepID=UPI0018F72AE6|nr:STAS domain-containing protein [Nucisporomicrobium flavum]
MTVVPADDRVSLHHLHGAALVQVVGDVDLDTASRVREVLETALGAHPRVIVDLARAGTFDSIGLSTLLAALRTARRRDGDLLLAAPSRLLLDVLQASRLDSVFATFGTVPQAMTAARVTAYAGRNGMPASGKHPGSG